ncbi:RNA polymerase factor sigma-54 [Dissulfurirhabdus thermomarina]|uniref:RNA polymerase factor sigma-54 n=1 Tax=Dissulfurirhabdus thermomarina TaxID=1765737 RepID=A0A6N9TKT7_DISTH|nr:RNA polymerase factor sigma-54 [Dissulfurirhabdus thermomarina]NDY41729.1 RNA polymerase factor sigma-54 [Dissulfurirhabdus thermomarina]NMX23665.1 RNA polymerase factor sigma-54 [Dissulfurirhabdus thermomarina]
MALQLRQQLKLSQQLVMTPQLQQAIKLLQLSRVELIETINQELAANPVLEEGTDEETAPGEAGAETPTDADEAPIPALSSTESEQTPWEDKALQEVDWREYWEDGRSALPAYSFEEKEAPNYEAFVATSPDLADHLLWQLQMSNLDDRQRQIACHVIGNLDPSGYLKATVEEIAKAAGASPEEVEAVLAVVQSFDPAGVAARDLRECLLLQIEQLGITDPLVRELVTHHLHHIERHNYQAMAKATGRSMEEIAAAIDVITGLEPRPGRPFSDENTHYIVPDIYVYKVDDDYVVVLNDEGLPRLRVSRFYRSALARGETPEQAKEFIQGKLKSALWLIRSIHQRQKTIYKVTKSIVRFQRDFLDKGIAHLKPLILRDVAEDVGMHESTISRVTTNKYVHTPQGIFELKFFFSSGLRRGDGGGDVATQSVKDRIRRLVQSEDPAHPYSDQQIVEILAKDNIRIARRTVAKYRDLLGILPSSRRKRPSLKR